LTALPFESPGSGLGSVRRLRTIVAMRPVARVTRWIVPIWLACVAAGCRTGPAKGPPDELLAAGREAYDRGAYREATRQFRGVTVRHPESDQAEEGHFRLAETYRARRDGPAAFEEYKKLAEEFPNSRFGAAAAEGEYALAMDQLAGRTKGFLFFRPDRSLGVDILEHLQLHYKNHRLADDALLEGALFRISKLDYEDASVLLRRLLVDYPRSENRMRARFELARSLYLMNQGPDYDERLLLQSRRGFRDFIGTAKLEGLDEQLAKPMEAADRMIKRIDERLGEHQYRIGRFYERIEAPDSAAFYYRYCLREYPATAAARDAAQRLEKLGKALPAEPAPAAGEPG